MKKTLFFLFPVLVFLTIISPVYAADVTTFVYPDNSDIIDNFVSRAGQLAIATYTFDDAELADYFDKQANITILAEKSPAGGLENKWILCMMQKNGAHIFLYDGKLRYMHAKYMIKNEEVLVSTENIGSNNRGWGAIVKDRSMAKQFRAIFDEDLKSSVQLQCNDTEEKTFKRKERVVHFLPASFSNQETNAVFAPGAENKIIEMLDGAKNIIYVQQFYIYLKWKNEPNPFLEKIIEKARQGIEVKILLDSTYYNKDSNGEVIDYINKIAEEEKLNMEARYIKNTYFEKSHTKGLIVDNAVLVSSINWNDNSVRNNREAGLLIAGEAADYYKKVFMADWDSNYGSITGKVSVSYSVLIGAIILIIIICLVAYFLLKRRRR